tara:strand:+ start:434 stop:880 length:447 start_codon:yes stop_codon:yes gene_type:complete
MKKTLIFIFCTLFSFFSFSQKKDALVGVWLEEEGQSKIKIYAVNTSEGIKYEGKIIWLEEPLRENGEIKLDDKNPNPQLREQTILGLIIMKDLKFKKTSYWYDGSIYDARSGKTYSLEIIMPDKNTLKLRGYLGISLIGKTTIWKRVK